MEQDGSAPMAGRTVLVTGASGGKATALGLAAMGVHLAITGRDRERTEEAAREIHSAGGGQVNVFVADLSSHAEVRRLAADVLRSLPRIDVLVNNVGGYWDTRQRDCPTTGPSSPACCSPTSWPHGCGARLSLPTRCIVAWCAPRWSRGPRRRPTITHPIPARVHEGAATSIHLASAPDLERVTGHYFANCKPRRSPKHAYD